MTEGASRNNDENLKRIDRPDGNKSRKAVLMGYRTKVRTDSSGAGNIQWWSLLNTKMNLQVSCLAQDFQLPRRSSPCR